MDTPVLPASLPNMGLSPFEAELFGNLVQSLSVLRGSAPQDVILEIMRGLKRFPQDIALNVSKEATLWLENYAGPRDFVELARKFYGVSKADLLAQGRAVFYELSKLENPQYDLICSNWRVVYAVKREFATLQNFFSTAEGEQPCWKQKRFAESFAHVDFVCEDKVVKEYFLEGFSTKYDLSADGMRYINFLGDYRQCKQILRQLEGRDRYLLPANPQDDLLLSLPVPAEELDSAAQAKTEIDPEKIKQVSEMLDAMAKEHERMKAVLG